MFYVEFFWCRGSKFKYSTLKMDNFVKFLKQAKNTLKQSTLPKTVHITLGNESCDLDSTVAPLLLGYILSKRTNQAVVVPVMNVSSENFLLRTENCYVLKNAGVDLQDLVYRNEINFQDLINRATVTVSMLDHHVLSKNDEILASHVTQIFDHRPIDSSYAWNKEKVSLRIEQVGSCSTLVADEILKNDQCLLDVPLAYMLYQVIIYDTIALNPKHGKAKALDLEIGTKLEKLFNFNEDRQSLFDRLWAAHNDVSHLTCKQLLYKDLKLIEGIYIPGLPMLVEDFFKRDGAYGAVVDFAVGHKVTSVLLVGLDATNTVKRDLGIYSTSKEDKLKKTLIELLYSNTEYDFQFELRTTPFSDIHLLHYHNTKLSRKQLVPIVKEAVTKCQNKQ